MSELVQRLRDYASNLGGDPEDYLTWQAADRIEQLEQELRNIDFATLNQCARIEALEAALRRMINDSMYRDHPEATDMARAALGEPRPAS